MKFWRRYERFGNAEDSTQTLRTSRIQQLHEGRKVGVEAGHFAQHVCDARGKAPHFKWVRRLSEVDTAWRTSFV